MVDPDPWRTHEDQVVGDLDAERAPCLLGCAVQQIRESHAEGIADAPGVIEGESAAAAFQHGPDRWGHAGAAGRLALGDAQPGAFGPDVLGRDRGQRCLRSGIGGHVLEHSGPTHDHSKSAANVHPDRRVIDANHDEWIGLASSRLRAKTGCGLSPLGSPLPRQRTAQPLQDRGDASVTPDHAIDEGPHPAALGLGEFDTTRPHPARVYACWLGGGKDAFAADRAAAAQIAEVAPWVTAGARTSRAFLRRAVRHLAAAGVTQFLDLGSGLPTAGNVHEIAQRVNPASRVCYVDNDPVVLAHARALLATDHRTIAVPGDLRHPLEVLADPAISIHLDLTLPVVVLLVSVLHFVTHAEDPVGITAAFGRELPPGSHLVISHVADLPECGRGERAGATRQAAKLYQDLVAPFALRTVHQVEQLFAGWTLQAPGLVPVHRWRPARGRPGNAVPVLAGVAVRGNDFPYPPPGAQITRSGPSAGRRD